MDNYITIGEAAKRIGRSPRTIKNWYEWEEKMGVNRLPSMRRDLDKKGTRYFLVDDVAKLEEFKNSIVRGQLAEVSRTKWGKRNTTKEGEENEV